MATAPPVRTPLGGATLNRTTFVDVAEIPAAGGDVATATWLPLMGISEFTPHYAVGSTQDSSDFDGEGYSDADVTSLAWSGEGKIQRKVKSDDPTAYDPGQELLRERARELGDAARFLVRMYEYAPGGPRSEAVTGYATVTVDWDGGDMTALKTCSITITGKGKPISQVHPFAS